MAIELELIFATFLPYSNFPTFEVLQKYSKYFSLKLTMTDHEDHLLSEVPSMGCRCPSIEAGLKFWVSKLFIGVSFYE